MYIQEKLYSLQLVIQFVLKVFPLVKRELAYWQTNAQAYAEKELRTQALSSIDHKQFHCLGGSIYALYPGVNRDSFVRLITALQTISDYLDNLCDRADLADEQAFRQLHLAMEDALNPDISLRNYYLFYPHKQDGNYLNSLVLACRQEVLKLPAYFLIKPYILELVAHYSALQTYKHLDVSIREEKMKAWMAPHLSSYPELLPYEFAAATGSTLGMFILLAAASQKDLTASEADHLFQAYFPWICGLHILLDYLIDRQEDLDGGDLNFTFYYNDALEMEERFALFLAKAFTEANRLPVSLFHQTVVHGLLAMYLSDAKTDNPELKRTTAVLLRQAGGYTKLLTRLCRLLRKAQVL